MYQYNLAPDEVIISEIESVTEQTGVYSRTYGKLIATNKNIVFIRNGTFGKPKDAVIWSLSEVKVYNDAAQIKVVTKSGTMVCVEIYLTSGVHTFSLNGFRDTAQAREFANAINHAVTGTDEDIYSADGDITPKKAFLKAMFLGANNIESKKAEKVKKIKVAIKCPACGATFEGIKGTTVHCPYCDSVYNA